MEKTKNKTKNIKIIISAILALVVVFMAILFIFGGKESIEENRVSEYPFLALNCKTSKPSTTAIFDTRSPKTEAHEIRGIFNKDGTLRSLFYMYEGEYASKKDASTASSSLHADYNIFMGKQKQGQDLFTPTFSYIDNRAKFSLYADNKNLNPENLAVFLLNSDVQTLTANSIEAAYKSKNFVCTMEEKNN